jgi:hypothetical protein
MHIDCSVFASGAQSLHLHHRDDSKQSSIFIVLLK